MISKEHVKILKMLSRKNSYYPPDPNPYREQLIYLSKLGYARNLMEHNVYGEVINSKYVITEEGKSYLYELKHNSREKWIPYIITTIISVLALMKSYGFGIDDIVIWYMQQSGQ